MNQFGNIEFKEINPSTSSRKTPEIQLKFKMAFMEQHGSNRELVHSFPATAEELPEGVQAAVAKEIRNVVKTTLLCHPINEGTFESNRFTVISLFNRPDNLWKKYNTAVSNYREEEDSQKLNMACKIAAAAIQLRNDPLSLKMTVVEDSPDIVKMTELSFDEFNALRELDWLLRHKSDQKTPMLSSKQFDNDEMLKQFLEDMTNAEFLGFLPSSWYEGHRMWKCAQLYKKQHHMNLMFVKQSGNENWNNIVDDFETKVLEGQILSHENSCNKFAVDIYCCTINKFKEVYPGKDSEDFLLCMKKVACFLNMSSISSRNWYGFVASERMFGEFLSSIEKEDYGYCNPGKLTKKRLFSCASSVFRAIEPTAAFCLRDRLKIVPQMITKIFYIEKGARYLSLDHSDISVSEHLFHVLTVLGSNNQYVHNRNSIPRAFKATEIILELKKHETVLDESGEENE